MKSKVLDFGEATSVIYTNATGSTINSDDVILIGHRMHGVSHDKILNLGSGVVVIRGRVKLDKDTSTIAIGDPLYWNDSTNACSTDVTAGNYIGMAAIAAATGATTVELDLNAFSESNNEYVDVDKIILTPSSGDALSISGTAELAIGIARGITEGGIRIGAWKGSQAAGNAVVMATTMCDSADSTQLDIVSVFGETVAELGSGYSAKVIRGRHLITASADTDFTQETYGIIGQLVVKNGSLGHYHSGIMGTFETSTLCHIVSGYSDGAISARLGGSGTTVASGGLLAGVSAIQHMSAFTNSGTIAGFATHKTASGIAWPIALYVQPGSATIAIDATISTMGAAGRVAKFFGTCAAGNMGDGYGMVECDLTITGSVAGMVSPLSSWVNIISATTGSNYICAQQNGLYSEAGGILTNGVFIFGMRADCLLNVNGGAVGATFYPFSVINNTNVTTAIFHCNDATSDLGEAASACAGAETMVPLFSDNEGIRYVKVYKHT